MSKGKAEFLRSLKEAVAQRKKVQAEERVALDYLKRWSKGLGENPNGCDLAWFKRFFDLLKSRHEAEQASCNRQIGKLFADCELNLSDPTDSELLLAALAQTIYPRSAGAKQKWGAKYYDELWHDILLVEEEYEAKQGPSDRELGNKAIADTLVRSKKFSAKYRSKKRGVEEKIGADSLAKRVRAAMNARLDHNPNLLIFDFDYILRGDPEKGPACAAGLSIQAALPRGSAAAEQAASFEKELFAEARAFFEALDLFMTDQSKFACRRAARRIARRRVRQGLEKDNNLGR
jgi:hypothetical protein